MKLKDTAPLFYVVLLGAFLWLGWLVMKPFIPGMVWAAVLVVTFKPLQERLVRLVRGKAWIAAGIVTVLVAAFVVVPIVVAAVQVVQGGIQLYHWTETAYTEQGSDLGARERWPWLEDATERAKELIGLANFDVKAAAIGLAKNVGTAVAAKAPKVLGATVGLVFSFLVMLVMMMVFFAEGPRLAVVLASFLPVPRDDADRIVSELGLMTRSVFISVGLTALVQATLAGIALAVLGVDNAFPLGAAMFFASVLPGGTALVWIPVVIGLFATGHPWKAAILAAWCAGVVSTIDNVLRPYFARGGVKLPTAVLILGLLGGLVAFGLVGLFLGPIVLYVLKELLGVYRREVNDGQPA